MPDRIDPDYDPTDKDVEAVARLFAMVGRRVGSIHYAPGGGNGNGFSKWMLGAMLLLFVAGVTALASVEYSVVQRLAILETKVDLILLRK